MYRANTTLGIADASEIDITVRFFAPHEDLVYSINVSLLTAVNDAEFDSIETVPTLDNTHTHLCDPNSSIYP